MTERKWCPRCLRFAVRLASSAPEEARSMMEYMLEYGDDEGAELIRQELTWVARRREVGLAEALEDTTSLDTAA